MTVKSEDGQKGPIEKQGPVKQDFLEVYLADIESAAFINCSVPTVWRWRKKGKIEFVRFSNGCVRDKLSSVMALAGQTSPAEISAQARAILRLRMETMRAARAANWRRQERKRQKAAGRGA